MGNIHVKPHPKFESTESSYIDTNFNRQNSPIIRKKLNIESEALKVASYIQNSSLQSKSDENRVKEGKSPGFKAIKSDFKVTPEFSTNLTSNQISSPKKICHGSTAKTTPSSIISSSNTSTSEELASADVLYNPKLAANPKSNPVVTEEKSERQTVPAILINTLNKKKIAEQMSNKPILNHTFPADAKLSYQYLDPTNFMENNFVPPIGYDRGFDKQDGINNLRHSSRNVDELSRTRFPNSGDVAEQLRFLGKGLAPNLGWRTEPDGHVTYVAYLRLDDFNCIDRSTHGDTTTFTSDTQASINRRVVNVPMVNGEGRLHMGHELARRRLSNVDGGVIVNHVTSRWRVFKSQTQRHIIGVSRRMNCTITMPAEVLFYRGAHVHPLYVKGVNKTTVIRCRNALPPLFTRSLITARGNDENLPLELTSSVMTSSNSFHTS